MTDSPKASWFEKLVTLDPALVRGLVVSVVALVGATLKVTVLTGTADNIITFILALFGLVAAVWIKPAVTPNAKVMVYDDTPLETYSTILPGEAVAGESDLHAVEAAAKVDTDGFQN